MALWGESEGASENVKSRENCACTCTPELDEDGWTEHPLASSKRGLLMLATIIPEAAHYVDCVVFACVILFS